MERPIHIRRAEYPADAEQLMPMWLALYAWVTDPTAEWEAMRQWFARRNTATFVAVNPEHPNTLVGYADVGERSIVEGCANEPAAFLEAWYVKDEWRRRGIGEALIKACAEWARDRGYTDIGSDALIDNTLSHRLHKKFGFEEVGRVVQFRMTL
jgi:aminoglycoside 6'-N-acetyltransferase I